MSFDYEVHTALTAGCSAIELLRKMRPVESKCSHSRRGRENFYSRRVAGASSGADAEGGGGKSGAALACMRARSKGISVATRIRNIAIR
jgi:hypothetical protein